MLPLSSVQCHTDICHRCLSKRSIVHSLGLCLYIHNSGLGKHPSFVSFLAQVFVKTSILSIAQKIFHSLDIRNYLSWNSLIKSYVKCGNHRQALVLYHEIKQKSFNLDRISLIGLLKACADQKDVHTGEDVHELVTKHGRITSDLVLGNALVNMYAKCGCLAKAQDVFDKLFMHDVISWNGLISGYSQHGFDANSLLCFHQMKLEGILPDSVTYVCSLSSCGSIGNILLGLQIHSEVLMKGYLENNMLVGNALVDMYARCRSILNMEAVFHKLPARDVTSWNTLISGYVKFEFGSKALDYFHKMQDHGMSPNIVTYVSILKACGVMSAIDKGEEIHVEILRKELLERSIPVGNALVDMYAECGLMEKSHEVFEKLPVQNIISWTALIAGYTEHGQGEEALACFYQMQDEGVHPNSVTFICILRACGSIGATKEMIHIHDMIDRTSLLQHDVALCNTLVDVYMKCGFLNKAQEVFCKFSIRDEILWTALISGYVTHGRYEEALVCFQQMQIERVSPNAVTLVFVLKACGFISAAETGSEIHTYISNNKVLLENDQVIGNALLYMYIKCGLIHKASELFDKLPCRDIITWTTIISGYAMHGFAEEALDCFQKMQVRGIYPNDTTFVCALKACSVIGALSTGIEIHCEITKRGILEGNHIVGNALIDMYAKCGSMSIAQEVFNGLKVNDIVSWTALISGYIQLGQCESSFDIFDILDHHGLEPDSALFVSVLNACSCSGLLDVGHAYFNAISQHYNFNPTLHHYTCIIDLLGRTGHLDKAVDLLKKMQLSPDIVLWHTILGACMKWGHMDLGRQTFEQILKVDTSKRNLDTRHSLCLDL